MKTHAGEPNYSCDLCEANFAQKKHLDQHKSLFHISIMENKTCDDDCQNCNERLVLESMKNLIESKLSNMNPCNNWRYGIQE